MHFHHFLPSLFLAYVLAAVPDDPLALETIVSTTPLNPIVCGSLTISWTRPNLADIDADGPLSIFVQSADGSQFQTLTQEASFGDLSFQWKPINVQAGQYIILLIDNTDKINGQSNPVTIGISPSDALCLGPSSSDSTATETSTESQSTNSQSQSVSQTSSTSGIQTHPISTSSRTTGTKPTNTAPGTSAPASVTSSGSGSTPGVPIDTASSGGTSTGVKVGVGVAAAIVIICGIGALYWFLIARRRYRSSNHTDNAFGGGAYGARKNHWAGLNSIDEYGAASRFTNTASKETKGQTDPLGRSFIAGTPAGISTATNLEKRSEEMSYPPQDQPGGIAYLPPATMSSPIRMTRTHSGSSASSGPRRIRTSSQQQDFPETPASHSLSSLGSVGIAIPMAGPSDPIRRSKGPVARKPVPLYPEDVDEHEAEPSPTASYHTDPFRSRPASTNSMAFVPSDVHSTRSNELAVVNLPEQIQRKSSFGELKPMQHVLVPDLPPAQRPSSPPIRISR